MNTYTADQPGICPRCRYRFEAATSLTGHAAPKEGDFSICFKCAAIMVFARDLTLECPSAETLHKFAIQDPKNFDALIKASILVRKQIKLHAERN